MRHSWKVAGLGVVLLVVTAAASGCEATEDMSATSDNGQEVSVARAGAADVCEKFVQDRLKSPGSATFRDPFGDQVTYTGDGDGPITVNASVDSENSFGASLRSAYTCTVSSIGDDRWRLVNLSLDDGGDISP